LTCYLEEVEWHRRERVRKDRQHRRGLVDQRHWFDDDVCPSSEATGPSNTLSGDTGAGEDSEDDVLF
jgi:hypothetical protein